MKPGQASNNADQLLEHQKINSGILPYSWSNVYPYGQHGLLRLHRSRHTINKEGDGTVGRRVVGKYASHVLTPNRMVCTLSPHTSRWGMGRERKKAKEAKEARQTCQQQFFL